VSYWALRCHSITQPLCHTKTAQVLPVVSVFTKSHREHTPAYLPGTQTSRHSQLSEMPGKEDFWWRSALVCLRCTSLAPFGITNVWGPKQQLLVHPFNLRSCHSTVSYRLFLVISGPRPVRLPSLIVGDFVTATSRIFSSWLLLRLCLCNLPQIFLASH